MNLSPSLCQLSCEIRVGTRVLPGRICGTHGSLFPAVFGESLQT